jgi:hypothetical protein
MFVLGFCIGCMAGAFAAGVGSNVLPVLPFGAAGATVVAAPAAPVGAAGGELLGLRRSLDRPLICEEEQLDTSHATAPSASALRMSGWTNRLRTPSYAMDRRRL